jgi:formimidoylglutamate deiminase
MEEFRLMEYGQRLVLRHRNVAARAARRESSAGVLLEGATGGATAAAGLPLAGLAAGQRADFVVLDPASSALAGIPASRTLDAAVFSSPDPRVQRVAVAGRTVEPAPPDVGRFTAAMKALWQA